MLDGTYSLVLLTVPVYCRSLVLLTFFRFSVSQFPSPSYDIHVAEPSVWRRKCHWRSVTRIKLIFIYLSVSLFRIFLLYILIGAQCPFLDFFIANGWLIPVAALNLTENLPTRAMLTPPTTWPSDTCKASRRTCKKGDSLAAFVIFVRNIVRNIMGRRF